MTRIKYVCLSDMHLGAENSLLTKLTADCYDTEPTKPSPVLVQLIECLRSLIAKNDDGEKPALVLNGDILELALTTDNLAAMAFERFIELILPVNQADRLFKEIIYLPGNHDHHLWETARETQYVNFITTNQAQQPGSLLKVPWHTTKMFDPTPPVPATFLNGIIQRYPHLAAFEINTVYPNFGILSQDSARCAIFSHGHFIESMYMLMSDLRGLMFPNDKPASSIYAIEAENFAWIDFFWSTMGRSGTVGTDVELVYDKLQSEEAMGQLIDNIVNGLEARYDLPGPDLVAGMVLKWVLRKALKEVKDRERMTPEKDLSADAEKGLKNYLEGPVLDQIIQERSGNIPDLTFVFGHTHKPFQRDMQFGAGYHPWSRVYNSGGWVVDTLTCAPTHGGAVILLDENLDSTSLSMYTEQATAETYKVAVKASTHPDATANPFHDQISSLVQSDQDPWKEFSRIVAQEVPMRYKNLQFHIDRN
ncbi:MAG TPA: hypothetical protein VKD91_16360 [Pyrinomonadaceae bacterium]|nr:hypothetical protein [Pyrinomonadaceae bacterium]